jgi:AbiV family abortive infection protein
MDRDNYIKIYDNALLHINIAKKAAVEENYGSAVSHLILGAEELMKYQVCISFFAKTSQFDEKEFEAVFKDHKIKIKLFKEFQESISENFTNALSNSIVHGKDQSENPIMKNRFKEIGSFLYHSYPELNLDLKKKKTFFDWLHNANNDKQKGLYVGYENGKWTFPEDISKKNYDIALEFIDILSKQTEVIKHLDLTEDELTNFLNWDPTSKGIRNSHDKC